MANSRKKRKNFFANDLKLGAKLSLVYIVGFVLVIAIMMSYVIVFLKREITQREEQDTVRQAARSANVCTYLFGSVEKTSLDIYNDEEIYEFLTSEYTDELLAKERYEKSFYPVLKKYAGLEYLESLTIYSDNPTLEGDEYLAYSDENIRNTSWYRAMQSISLEGSSYWGINPYEITSGEERAGVIAFYKLLRGGSSHGYKNIVVFEVDIEKIGVHIRDNLRRYTIINSNGYVVYSDKAEDSGKYYSDLDECFDPRMKEHSYYIGANEGRSFVSYNSFYIGTDIENPWYTVVSVGEEFLNGMIWEMVTTVIMIGGFTFAVLLFVLLLVIRTVTGRIKEVIRGTARIEAGIYGEQIPVEGKDEIGTLATDFNKMSERLNNLFNETYLQKLQLQDYEIAKAKAEFRTLQSQINPHFLYNTLEIIRMHAVLSNNEEIAEMLVTLSKLFRYNISPDVMVSVFEEVEYCKTYIFMLNIRASSKIVFNVRLGEEILRCRILKTVLQPLIENCVKHGLINGLDGEITLDGRVEENAAVLSLSDNGVGIEKEELVRLQQSLRLERREDTVEQVGLFNVNDRLRLYFGERYGVWIIGREQGTTVEIRIPFVYKGEQ